MTPPAKRRYIAFVAFFSLLLSLLAATDQAAFAAPSGALIINDSGGDSLPTPSGGVYDIQTNIAVAPADIEAALSSGNVTLWATSITVESDIDVPNSNSLTLKATGNIEVDGGVDITSLGGHLILWADSDSNGTSTSISSGGTISIGSAASIDSGGGDIYFAGGNDDGSNGGSAGDGLPDGFAYGAAATSLTPPQSAAGGTAAVFLDRTTLSAGAGAIVVRGHGTGGGSIWQTGVWINRGLVRAASVDISGNGSTNPRPTSSQDVGVHLMGADISATGSLVITGRGGAGTDTSSNSDFGQLGVAVQSGSTAWDNVGTKSSVTATGSGTITIRGFGGGASPKNDPRFPHGIQISPNQVLSSDSGDISLRGEAGYGNHGGGNDQGHAVIVFGPVTSASGTVQLRGDINTSGPAGLGKVEIQGALTATNLKLEGAGAFTLTNTSNAIGTLAAGSSSSKVGALSLYDASGGLTIGQVGLLEGVTATGDVEIETGAGDITLAKNIATDSTLRTAITLNAGDTTSAGTGSGGNIVVSGSPTLTTGSNGIVRLFSGSDSGSTGLTTLVGGSSNVYYGVDESSSLSPSLSNGAAYALYRGKETPQLSVLSNRSVTSGAPAVSLTAPTATNRSAASVAGSTTWSTSNSSVASISGTTLTYGSVGTAVVTATFTPTDTTTYQTATATLTVTVSAVGGGSSSSSSSSVGSTPVPSVAPTVTSRQNRIVPVTPNTNPVPRPVERLGLVFDPDAPSRVTVGGASVNLLTSSPQPSVLSLTAGVFQFGVSLNSTAGAEVRTETPSRSPELFVPRGQSAAVSGGGSYPGSFVQLFLPGSGEDSRELARIPVRSDGTFASDLGFEAGALELPVPIGRQVLQVVGYDQLGNQTVVDMTINIGQGVPAPEPNRQIGALPALLAGQSLATSRGIPETVSVTGVPETGNVVVEGSGWVIGVNADRENGVVENADGNVLVRLNPSSVGTTFGNGFLPGTLATVWLFSDPTLMATVTVDDKGEFSAEFLVDSRLIAPGEHTLQVQGVGSDGYIKAANLGVLVEQPVEVTGESASGLLWWVLGFFLLALLLFLFLLARRRRRQDA